MTRQWEPHDLDRLAGALDTIREMAVQQVGLADPVPVVWVAPQTLIHVASLTHRRPTVDERPLPSMRFAAELTFGQRLRITASCTTADLEELGYRVTTRVVPIEEATQDANRT